MARNRLAEETSPYLRQHADNPVDWHPWGEAALAAAQAEDRPVLLSIGYAACHWCHVMAHESFEDPAIAAVMNENFVNVKIDREERPDLDAIYQQALALMGEQGGWPLTMFCTPDGKPFWGGTYFPPAARYGRPGFPDLLRHIARIYREEHDKVETNTGAILDAIGQIARPDPGAPLAAGEIEEAVRAIAGTVDSRHGGFGDAPKFPQAPILKLLWTVGREAGIAEACEAVTLTLDRMAQGGIYDHLGGGFARYATDAAWLVPHFEKMLYDNTQLIELYTMAWRATGSPLHAARIEETVGWLVREMTDEGGAFHATLDADSEGEEGRFYVWDASEIRELLGEDYDVFAEAYDVRPDGNWEGKTILNRTADPAFRDAEGEARLARCRARLFARRGERVRPGLDDKVLADWNGLAVAALADAAMAFGRPDWLAAAERAFAFVVDAMGAPDGEGGLRLAHSWRDGIARPVATLDDHAQMARAALALFEATGEEEYIGLAHSLVAVLEASFRDEEGHAFYFTPDDAADVIARTRPGFDNATPSGNGAMVEVYARLFHLTGEDRFRERATALLEAFAGEARKNPFGFGTLLSAARLLDGAVQIAIVGTREDAATRRLVDAAWRAPVPLRIVQVTAPDARLPDAHPAAGKGQAGGVATAYVCRGPVCSLPVTAPEALTEALAA